MGNRESYPGPEPFTAFTAHVRQVWEAEKWPTLGGAIWPADWLWRATMAVPLGIVSHVGITKLVWRLSHR